MTEYFDELETRSADTREQELFRKLPEHLAAAVKVSSGLADHLNGYDLNITRATEKPSIWWVRKSRGACRQSDIFISRANLGTPRYGC